MKKTTSSWRHPSFRNGSRTNDNPFFFVGTWQISNALACYEEEDYGEYIQIKKDGTYIYVDEGASVIDKGKWKVVKDELLITWEGSPDDKAEAFRILETESNSIMLVISGISVEFKRIPDNILDCKSPLCRMVCYNHSDAVLSATSSHYGNSE